MGLLVVWVTLRYCGERWWLPLVGLYAPPVGFLFPAPVVLALTWRWASRRWLVGQLLVVVLALFGLLGLQLGLGRHGRAAQEPSALHIVSYNIEAGARGVPGIVAQVMAMQPNLVLLQEVHQGIAAQLRNAFFGWHIDMRGQFFLASRFPILEVREPGAIHYQEGEGGSPRSGDGAAHFLAYTIDTSLGPVDVYNVHTSSPREGLEDMRGSGFLYELRHGHVRFGRNGRRLEFNAYRRRRQVQSLMVEVRARRNPVLIAGDFNLPALSRVIPDELGGLDDGFAQAGLGFGYTYPTKFPFLRIDRVFTGRGLRVVDFQVGESRASDHHCISAVVTSLSP